MQPITSGTDSATAQQRRFTLWAGLVLVLISMACATYARLSQDALWRDDPDRYTAGGVPVMTTADAYYSLRLARLQANGTFVPHGPVPERHYYRPEGHDPNTWFEQREPRFLPLLSRLVAALAPLHGGSVDRAAFVLPAWLASLFMLPLFLYFWRLGLPAAGLLGGLVATFSLDYFYRTTLGWLDTDALNLFFPCMASCVIAAMHAGQTRRLLLGLSALVGFVLLLYHQWYVKPGMTLIYLLVMAAHLWLTGVRGRTLGLCLGVALLCSNPMQFRELAANLLSFIDRYLAPVSDHGTALRLPQVWATIGEATRIALPDLLSRITGHAVSAVIGLLAFAVLAMRAWRALIAFAPLIALGLLALVTSSRFVLYLAPLVGIGWGYLLWLIVRKHWQGARGNIIACVAGIAVFAIGAAPQIFGRAQPAPAIPGQVVEKLQHLKGNLPSGTRLWTWWDLGFALVDITGFGVYHDGSAQYTAQTNLVAASFMTDDPRAMHEIIRYVDREGNLGLRTLMAQSKDFPGLVAKVRAAAGALGPTPVHVLFTPDMLLKYEAMHWLGTEPAPPASGPGLDWMNCQHMSEDKLHCGRATVDLAEGVITDPASGTMRLRRSLVIEDGRVARERDFGGSDSRRTLQVVLHQGRIGAVYVLEESAFRSNLNQMYLLGRYDAALFEPSADAFPFLRAYRVLPATTAAGGGG